MGDKQNNEAKPENMYGSVAFERNPHLFVLLVSPRFGDCRLAGYLDMSICRVFFGPRQIGLVPSQLVFNGTPIRIEPYF